MEEQMQSKAPRLSAPARALVVDHVVRGETDEGIRTALDRAGYPCNLTRQAIAYYRSQPEVQKALEQIELESVQAGLSMRAKRVRTLNTSLATILIQIRTGRSETTQDAAGLEQEETRPLRHEEFVRMGMLALQALRMLGDLMDGRDSVPLSSQVAEQIAQEAAQSAPQAPKGSRLTPAEVDYFFRLFVGENYRDEGKSEEEIAQLLDKQFPFPVKQRLTRAHFGCEYFSKK